MDPSAPPVFGLANVPSLNWAIGVPSETDPSKALQHQVFDCAVEQGGTLRLFGKNFAAPDQVVLQRSNGIALSLAPSTSDANSATVSIPNNLATGTYSVWIGNLPWSATSSAAARISINAPTPLATYTVSCPGLVGDAPQTILRLFKDVSTCTHRCARRKWPSFQFRLVTFC